jgi:hypothetical protein
MSPPGLRLPAVAAFVGVACWATAAVLFPQMSDALDPGTLDRGLAELGSHFAVAMTCQHLFAIADMALIVFMSGLAGLAPPPLRPLASLGAFLFCLCFFLDVLVAASVIAVTQVVAPHAATDSAWHAAGIATLGVAAVIDFREGFFWMAGSILLGGAAWHGRYWPRWLAGLAILNGILAFPYLPFLVSFVLCGGGFILWVLGMGVILWRRGRAPELAQRAAPV